HCVRGDDIVTDACIAYDDEVEEPFFFSSRRRHTIFSRDWSSDVCSSDLCTSAAHPHQTGGHDRRAREVADVQEAPDHLDTVGVEIGRASCRGINEAFMADADAEEELDIDGRHSYEMSAAAHPPIVSGYRE